MDMLFAGGTSQRMSSNSQQMLSDVLRSPILEDVDVDTGGNAIESFPCSRHDSLPGEGPKLYRCLNRSKTSLISGSKRTHIPVGITPLEQGGEIASLVFPPLLQCCCHLCELICRSHSPFRTATTTRTPQPMAWTPSEQCAGQGAGFAKDNCCWQGTLGQVRVLILEY